MALPTNADVAKYLRIDEVGEELDLIDELIKVAQEDLKDSGITNEETSRYGMAIKLLVANFYEERKPQVVGTITSKLNYSLERIILQLKADELPEVDEE